MFQGSWLERSALRARTGRGFESRPAPQAGRISSRYTKVLISICASLVSHRFTCEAKKRPLGKKSSASPHRCENNGTCCKDEGAVRIDKQSFNTFV